MIRLERILTSGRSLVGVPGDNKKRVLEQIANLVTRGLSEFDARTIFEDPATREKLSSIGFSNGIVVLHCCLSGCQSLINAVLHLDVLVDFDVLDSVSVDLLFVLLVPETAIGEHLGLFRQIAAVLDRVNIRDRLRSAPATEILYQIVVDVQNGQ